MTTGEWVAIGIASALIVALIIMLCFFVFTPTVKK
jgi:hypothetical protein